MCVCVCVYFGRPEMGNYFSICYFRDEHRHVVVFCDLNGFRVTDMCVKLIFWVAVVMVTVKETVSVYNLLYSHTKVRNFGVDFYGALYLGRRN